MNKIKSLLVKMFAPSAKTLAGYAAKGIQKSVNDTNADVKERIAKYSTTAATATEIANKLSAMAMDGTIDNKECEELAHIVEPLFERVLALAK